MRSVRREHTAPELAVRKALHQLGFRFRLHDPKLPGKPDIVLRKCRAVIFVHGCFWHGHECAHGSRAAKTNTAWWTEKIEANKARDARKKRELMQIGWNVMTIWECETKSGSAIMALAAALRRRAEGHELRSNPVPGTRRQNRAWS
jgi:DNA mismatch endonuclease, patch repair protein